MNHTIDNVMRGIIIRLISAGLPVATVAVFVAMFSGQFTENSVDKGFLLDDIQRYINKGASSVMIPDMCDVFQLSIMRSGSLMPFVLYFKPG